MFRHRYSFKLFFLGLLWRSAETQSVMQIDSTTLTLTKDNARESPIPTEFIAATALIAPMEIAHPFQWHGI